MCGPKLKAAWLLIPTARSTTRVAASLSDYNLINLTVQMRSFSPGVLFYRSSPQIPLKMSRLRSRTKRVSCIWTDSWVVRLLKGNLRMLGENVLFVCIWQPWCLSQSLIIQRLCWQYSKTVCQCSPPSCFTTEVPCKHFVCLFVPIKAGEKKQNTSILSDFK